MTPLKRVLLVDDDHITNTIHLRIINKTGLAEEVLVAKDGQQALDILADHIDRGVALPELILLDINMPGMGGFQFLEEYAARNFAVQGQMVIVMLSTSLLQADHARAAADPNVFSFAEKPMTPQQFCELVDMYTAETFGVAAP